MQVTTEQKQQHYIPCCYSKFFCNSEGYLYLKDTWDGRVFPGKPQNVLKQSYLYRQPVHAEKRFDNAIENFFSRHVESRWPDLIKKISAREDLTREEWSSVIEFYLSMRVRVPNTIKSVIFLLRESVIKASNAVDQPVPDVFRDVFLKKRPGFSSKIRFGDLMRAGIIDVQIDPHTAILSFEKLIRTNDAVHGINSGPQFLHNETGVSFISSDNPSISHIFSNNIDEIRPYSFSSHQNVEFILPLTSRIALLLHSKGTSETQHRRIFSEKTIKKINSKIYAYSDRYIFSDNPATLYPDIPPKTLFPVPDPSTSWVADGVVNKIYYKFGPPLIVRNKWRYEFETSP